MSHSNPACDRVRGRLERLLDGGLEPLEAARDRGHLEACQPCAAEEETWHELFAGIREASRPELGELSRVTAETLRALEGLPVPRRSRSRAGLGWTAAIAAAVLVALCLDFSGLGWRPGAHLDTARLAPLTDFDGWGELLPEVPRLIPGEGR